MASLDPHQQPSHAPRGMFNELSFITDVCGALKKLKRTGWVKRSVPLPESDADHMWRCAMCAMLVGQPADNRDNYEGANARFLPSKVDSIKLLRMAVSHDICESLAGDITPHCSAEQVAGKHEAERKAMEHIKQIVGDPLGGELYDLWAEYEAQETTEALLCKDIDKFEMVVQAYEYERDHLQTKPDGIAADAETTGVQQPSVSSEPLRSFFRSTSSTMKSPLFRRLDAELRVKREDLLERRGWIVSDAERQQA